jgi:putative heme iron utilization protein
MENIYKEYFAFMKKAKSVYISSVDENTKPEISYSPCVVDDEKKVYILVSELSKRTSSLVQGRNVSLMFIEPEDQCEELYVRIRLIFECSTKQIERKTEKWNELIPVFLEKFGDIINILKSLSDFKLFCFSPVSGSYVKGFGKAYTIEGKTLDQISHVNFSANQKM